MGSPLDRLRAELSLIDEASQLATSQLEKRVIYHGLDWEIGMSIASTNGDQTAAPFITLVFSGTNTSGEVASHAVTLTLLQFQDFVGNVQRMQKAAQSFA
jgi:hypothetical protein